MNEQVPERKMNVGSSLLSVEETSPQEKEVTSSSRLTAAPLTSPSDGQGSLEQFTPN